LTIDGKAMYTPCGPSDKGAEKKSLYEMEKEELHLDSITFQDFLNVLSKTKP